MNLQARLEIKNQAKERVKTMTFGEPVTNVCAGEGNPRRHSYFVEYVVGGYTNKAGIRHNDYLAKCTDRKGKFWKTDIEVIYAGHLDSEKCKELFEPVWKAYHGT